MKKLSKAARRAAARAAAQARAQQTIHQLAQEPAAPPPAPKPAPTPAQVAANRANAKLSTGPVTDPGRAASRMNALKHGLTSREVLFYGDDPAEYQRKFQAALDHFDPQSAHELELVKNVVDNRWRAARANRLEYGYYAKGAREFKEAADKIPDLGERLDFVRTETHHTVETGRSECRGLGLRWYGQLNLIAECLKLTNQAIGSEASCY
jgi:hypothetical protein